MAKQKKLKLGDIVQLNSSDNPKMTVVGYAEDGRVECCWGESEKLKRASFPAEALTGIKDTSRAKFIQNMNSALKQVYGERRNR